MDKWRAWMQIPATPHGVRAARHVVTALLPGWDLADLSADAELLVSELATNVYRHAPETDSIELELVRRANGIRICLADGTSIRPIIRELSHDRPSGRGMVIVAAIATAWAPMTTTVASGSGWTSIVASRQRPASGRGR